ncbi:MAG: hypothetical protein FJW39_35620, partial [Acidobacteria bacterium]|nr:hypothetical protein [Acidobacteriota bacterium]
MPVQLLNLISTPIPVLNSLGLDLSVGLSSDDPVVGRHPSEVYRAYLTIYSPEGRRLDRVVLGDIPPRRRRLFDISGLTRRVVSGCDHLVVVHRVPARLADQTVSLDDPVEMEEPDYSLFRSLIQYAYPGRGNGSVIYETPPRLNMQRPGGSPSTTLTFTSKIVLSSSVRTYVVPIHYSMNPAYAAEGHYRYVLLDAAGRQVLDQTVAMPAFTVRALDLAAALPSDRLQPEACTNDELACFSFVAWCADAALAPLVLNVASDLGGVSVEHTHPAQAFLMPGDDKEK